MAVTQVHSTLDVQHWADDEMFEYVRMVPFKSAMGTSENSIIHVKEDLMSGKNAGDNITFALVHELDNDPVLNDNQLEGSEEAMLQYGDTVTVRQERNGVVVGSFEKIKTKIDLLNAAKVVLRLWNAALFRDLVIQRGVSPNTDGLTTYDGTAEADRDSWMSANNPATTNQRILVGAAKSNFSGDHSADLSNVDGTADDAHQDIIRLLRRLAQSCDPAIRPIVSSENGNAGNERFVNYMGSLPFRDLESNFETVQQNAGVRGDNNQIFSSGDIRIGNVICKEIPEMDRYTDAKGATAQNAGDSATTDVGTMFFCGAQAWLMGIAQRMQVKMDDFDYQNRRGVAVSEIRGIKKAVFNSFDHGMVTGYVSAVGD